MRDNTKLLPAVPLQLDLPWGDASRTGKQGKRRKGSRTGGTDEDNSRLIYYGAGALTGAMLLRLVRRRLCRIPVVGVIATPFLALVPCTLLGALAGATVVYSVEQGDMSAVRRKLLPTVKRHVTRARDEVAAVAADLRGEAGRLRREHERAVRRLAREGERLAPALQEAAAEAERALAPALKHGVERGRRELERSLRALEDAAAAAGGEGGRGGGRRWHHGQGGPRAGAPLCVRQRQRVLKAAWAGRPARPQALHARPRCWGWP